MLDEPCWFCSSVAFDLLLVYFLYERVWNKGDNDDEHYMLLLHFAAIGPTTKKICEIALIHNNHIEMDNRNGTDGWLKQMTNLFTYV